MGLGIDGLDFANSLQETEADRTVMPRRQITLEELNKLFCSPEFIRKVECSGRPSAVVYLEATDQHVARWLDEGGRMERYVRRIESGSGSPRQGCVSGRARGGRGDGRGRAVFAGVPRFSRAGDGVAVSRTHVWSWPAPALVFLVLFGLTSLVAGPAIARLATHPVSLWSGFFGIAVGCWWHIFLYLNAGASVTSASMHGDGLVAVQRMDGNEFVRWIINAEYYLIFQGRTLFALIELFSPLLCGLVAVLTVNYWVRCYKTGKAF